MASDALVDGQQTERELTGGAASARGRLLSTHYFYCLSGAYACLAILCS